MSLRPRNRPNPDTKGMLVATIASALVLAAAWGAEAQEQQENQEQQEQQENQENQETQAFHETEETPCLLDAPPQASELLPHISTDPTGREVRVVSAELDGTAPSEAVLIVEPGEQQLLRPSAPADLQSQLWVFRRLHHGWQMVTHSSWAISQHWDGTIEGAPGFEVVRPERLFGPCHDVLRVEFVDLQGGVDPRYRSRSFELLTLEGARLRRIFSCPVVHFVTTGPERAVQKDTRRVIRFEGRAHPPRIRVSAGRRATIYRFDGRTYRARGRISECRYLGELGYELYVPTEQAVHVYDRLIEAGGPLGLRHAGLKALASLRMEKAYRDYGHDIDNTDTVLEAGLRFAVRLKKPKGFLGRDAVVAQREAGPLT